MKYYLSLGSNLGDRKTNLEEAVSFLKNRGKILNISSIYETSPVDMPPGSANFYNLVLCLESDFSPYALLGAIKEFEKNQGRDTGASQKMPRPIDIDILLADDLIVAGKELYIPHEKMHKRAFVLAPLAEIAASMLHPVLKKTIKDILDVLCSAEPQTATKI
ncbi:MAG: 2-amino-4-hydroxy-6-hydroxymethyldihydropteridine diphosphokinase [Candidatus Aminicenantes bacterium]|nr:2-amino-4-hydroxy-6-hydroxymethyldihydropteridine diphosphokinase [Candidatus Aminicenantes bacterium]